MTKTEKDILTTADTAKLLGVSIRTAQLLIEGGTITSWKTPGGHRRVYRADVMALIEGGGRAPPLPSSAVVVVIGSAARLAVYEQLFAQAPECTTETFENVLAALVAIGSIRPHAVLVDIDGIAVDRTSLLQSLADNPMLANSRIVAVGAASQISLELSNRVVRADEPGEAVTLVRTSLKDAEEMAFEEGSLPFPIALNERQRLVALERSGLLDSPPEEAFDRLTWLAAQSLDVPIALLTLLTPTRQWFKSKIGLDLLETPRSWAFCNHTIMQKQVFSVSDLAKDPRFADNPAVRGEPGLPLLRRRPCLGRGRLRCRVTMRDRSQAAYARRARRADHPGAGRPGV